MDLSSQIDPRFGRCNCFTLHDTEKDTYEFLDNTSIHQAHGAGIAAAQYVSELNAEVVLTGRLGPKALRVLNDSGIVGYKAEQGSLEEAVLAFKMNKLSKIDSPT